VSMQRTIRRAILRNQESKKRYHTKNRAGKFDRTPRAFKAEKQRRTERRMLWPFGRKRENKRPTLQREPQDPKID